MKAYKITISIMLFFIGGGIYLLFRDKSLLMFRWCEAFGIDLWIDLLRSNYTQQISLTNWIKYSLPDGLWLLSYLLFIDSLWGTVANIKSYLWYAALPIIAISSELMQYIGLTHGTFDILDLLCYIGAILIFYFLKLFTYMKTHIRFIASGIILSIFLIAAGGSDDSFGVVLFVIIIIGIILGIAQANNHSNAEARKAEEEKSKRIEEQERRSEKRRRLIEEFGTPTKEIRYNGDSYLFVYERGQKITFDRKIYKFTDILNYSISDNAITIYSQTISETKTNTGSMLGRAVVGGILTGGVGAIIGGATAKTTTIDQGRTSKTEHQYEIIITVNNIANPVVKLKIGDNSNTVSEISSLLSVILSRNTKHEETTNEEDEIGEDTNNFDEVNFDYSDRREVIDENLISPELNDAYNKWQENMKRWKLLKQKGETEQIIKEYEEETGDTRKNTMSFINDL